jgi:hypothetical protein
MGSKTSATRCGNSDGPPIDRGARRPRQLAILAWYDAKTRRAVCATTYPLIEQGRAGQALAALDDLGPSTSPRDAAWWQTLRTRCLQALGRDAEAQAAATTAMELSLAAEARDSLVSPYTH